MSNLHATVVGAGLAGSEAAWQLARQGIAVTLIEMKPEKMSPAHHSPLFAELVCSNSLRSDRLTNAVGLLKEEMRLMHSLVMEAADLARVPAGGALAVDRETFSGHITKSLREHPLVEVVSGEVTEIPDGPVIIATGPLTSDALSETISRLPGLETLNFYDAAAPIVTAESLNMDKVFRQSRYDRGDDYLNCPMTEEEYNAFVDALLAAETADIHGFEETKVFEGRMPVESMARRGRMVLAFGPMKPVGLRDPKTGKEPYAVVQLRQDNATGTLYNLVGFQTRLKWGEQKRVFGMIPGLENAEFARYGVMHRNTFLHSPGCALRNDFASAVLFRRTDDGRRGLCGKRGERSALRLEPWARFAWAGHGRTAGHHCHGRNGTLCLHAEPRFSADELHVRPVRWPAGGQAAQKNPQ